MANRFTVSVFFITLGPPWNSVLLQFLDVSDVVYTSKFIKTLALLRVAKGAHMIRLILKIEENKIAHLVFLSALGRGKDC